VSRIDRPAGGFEPIREGRMRGLVRSDVRTTVLPLLRDWAEGALPTSPVLSGGRAAVGVFDLAAGLSVVVRPYRRGGFVRRFNRDLYLGVRPRPVRELRAILHLRSRAVPTVEPLAAAVHWLVPGLYRGALVTRHVPLAVNLWQYLRDADPAARERACRGAAASVRRLHDSGTLHPDLNLQNFLVRPAHGEPEVLVIDLDRARRGDVSPRQRRAAFERICRSMRRLDPTAEVLTLGCVEAFRTIVES
jgi:hypothetical protein